MRQDLYGLGLCIKGKQSNTVKWNKIDILSFSNVFTLNQASLVAQMVKKKSLPAMLETLVWFPRLGRYWEKGMTTHSSIPA